MRSILLIDDDPATAQMYGLRLRLSGYAVHSASGATMGEMIYAATSPDLVCIDSRLPDCSGAELASKLMAFGASVMMLTNDFDAHERPPAGVVGSHLKARTTPSELVRLVQVAIGPAQPESAIAAAVTGVLAQA